VTGTRFLDPKVLARIGNLELIARTVVDGFISGLHHAPYLGLSTDFAEHRPYLPGDDIRRIDWRVWGRTDRLYVKEFEADTNANFSVLLDISRSMAYGSAGLTKLNYGRYLAACLTYFSRQQRDRVGLVTFDRDVVTVVPPSAKHLERVLHELARIEPGPGGALGPSLLKIADTVRRRSLLVVISDLYEEPDAVVRAVSQLKGKGNDVIVFQILDAAELHFPFEDMMLFEDLESGDRVPVVPDKQRERYRQLMQEHVGALSRMLVDARIDYALFDTSKPLDFALFEYLSRRERLVRVR
jgi:uncharacterized protein (DUF58 family)